MNTQILISRSVLLRRHPQLTIKQATTIVFAYQHRRHTQLDVFQKRNSDLIGSAGSFYLARVYDRMNGPMSVRLY